ncbi:hypothetical protein RB195_004428 [Necator americanus]|uniref:Uncharacterized protein n=1 Tax=Necator americanus TaxID=51031 RepID=A0ABR1BHY5_NECAM
MLSWYIKYYFYDIFSGKISSAYRFNRSTCTAFSRDENSSRCEIVFLCCIEVIRRIQHIQQWIEDREALLMRKLYDWLLLSSVCTINGRMMEGGSDEEIRTNGTQLGGRRKETIKKEFFLSDFGAFPSFFRFSFLHFTVCG